MTVQALLGLECGHNWPGEAESAEKAEEFLGLLMATGDAARCPECGAMSTVTGPVSIVGAASRAPGVVDAMRESGYHDIVIREGDVVDHLREQATSPPVNPLGLRLLLDWAADEITRLRVAVSS